MEAPFKIDAAMKAQAWEMAKGALRALVAIQGSYQSGGYITSESGIEMTPEYKRFDDLNARVEAFIRNVQEDGLHE
jgi:hypothetical protein